jgi:hypothetical protein
VVVVTGVGSPRQLHALEMRAGARAVRGSLFRVDLLVVVAPFVVAGFRLKALSLIAAAAHVVTV